MSGTTFSVNTFPQQLYPGWQETVTLINNGPSSVWIDSGPSVNLITSFRLRPNGVVTWQANKPLWGVCDDLSSFSATHNGGQRLTGARLTAMDGTLSAVNNVPDVREIARFDNPSINYSNSVPYTLLFETSSYQSVRIDALFATIALVPCRLFVTYYTDEKLVLASDVYAFTVADYMIRPANSMVIPTRGAYTSIRLVPDSFPGDYNLTFIKFTGFANALEVELSMRDVSSATNYGFPVVGPNSEFTSARSTARNINLGGWTGRNVHLPALGRRLRYYLLYSVQPGTFFIIFSNPTGQIVRVQSMPISSDVAGENGEFIVPESNSLIMSCTRTDLSLGIDLTWSVS